VASPAGTSWSQTHNPLSSQCLSLGPCVSFLGPMLAWSRLSLSGVAVVDPDALHTSSCEVLQGNLIGDFVFNPRTTVVYRHMVGTSCRKPIFKLRRLKHKAASMRFTSMKLTHPASGSPKLAYMLRKPSQTFAKLL